MLAGLVVAAVCGAAGATAPGTPTLLATRVGEGLGLVLAASAVPGLLVRVTAARDHGPMFGIWATFMPLGIGLATLATPALLAHRGWQNNHRPAAAAARHDWRSFFLNHGCIRNDLTDASQSPRSQFPARSCSAVVTR